jgi:hypothetical protein
MFEAYHSTCERHQTAQTAAPPLRRPQRSVPASARQIKEKRPIPRGTGVDYGAETENRTRDTRFFRPVLYQLSYLGKTLILQGFVGF